MSEQKRESMANYMALETAISNGEEELVKQLLDNREMLDIEKSYLLDLAELNGNQPIIRLLKAVPVKK